MRSTAWRLARAGTITLFVAGALQTLGVARAAADTSQASNVNVSVMSPGEDEGTLSGYERCTGTQGVFNQGYYAFPSKQSTIDNGLQTDIGNDQGMLKITFDLPNSVNNGVIDLTAPSPPRPTGVPGSAPWGTAFPQASAVIPGAPALYGCNSVPAGTSFETFYYAVQVATSSGTQFNFPGSVTVNPTAPNQVQIPFGFTAGTSNSSLTVYIANVVNAPEGTYSGVNYTVSVQGSTALPAPSQTNVTYVNTTPDPTTSQLTSSLTSADPTLTATNVPSDGAVLTATIYDSFYNPVQGESIFIGVAGGPGGAETAPIGSAPAGSGSGGNGEPQTGSNGQAQYYAYGTTATPPGDPDTFFAEDTTSGIFVDQPPPAPANTLATVAIPITAADPNPPSNAGSSSSVSAFGGNYVSAQETQVTADGSSTATISITLVDQFGNPDSDQAIIIQPMQPPQPAPSENFKHVVITPNDPPTPGSACSQGPSSQIPGISCTDSTGTTSFSVTDTLAESVQFAITDLTDGFVLPTLYLPTDAPNIPIVDFLPGPTSTTTSTVSVDGSESATVLADGNAQATVNVNLLDAEGNAEINKVVTLAGSPGTNSVITAVNPSSEISLLNKEGCSIPTPGTTDCNGNAYFTVSDSNVETVTYTADDTTDGLVLTGANQQPVVSFVTGAVSASNSTVSANPPTIVGDGQGVSVVTVTVEDGGSHALDGETVTLNTSAYPSITTVPPTATTNASGAATFDVRSSSPLGAVSLPVTVGTTLLDSSADITFTQPPDPAFTSVSATPPNPEATGSPDETVSLHLADSTNTPIQGLSVELLGGSVPATPPTGTTDSGGGVSFSVGASLPGPVTYTAVDLSDNDRTLGTVIVIYVPIPDEAHESMVTASPAATYTFVSGQPLSSQSSTVTVTLNDATGTPIAGDTVSLAAISPGGNTAVISPNNGGVTDSNGVATFTVTDPNPENVTFQATDSTTGTTIFQTAQVSFVLRPNENTTSTITAAPTTVEADGHSSSTVTVTLQNNGVLLSGDTVSLSQGQGDSIITTSDPVSNSSGQVQFTVTDLTPQSVAYQATDLTTATELTHDAVVTFTTPPGGSLQPAVTSIAPTSGPGTGGTDVTILGSNFTGATSVHFGLQLAPTFTINPSGTEIVAVSPIPVAAGSVNVTVSGPGGTSPSTAADVFTYTSSPPLKVTSIDPSAGPVAGGTKVVIHGTGLANVTAVRFGDLHARFVLNPGDASITAIAPAATQAGRVNVVAAGVTAASPSNAMDVFAFVGRSRLPAITSLVPSSGPLRGGTLVTIHGLNLTHVTAVEFGGVHASIVQVRSSGTSITVRSPASRHAGVVRVTVVTRVGSSSSVVTDRFTYVRALSSSSAARHTTAVLIEGAPRS